MIKDRMYTKTEATKILDVSGSWISKIQRILGFPRGIDAKQGSKVYFTNGEIEILRCIKVFRKLDMPYERIRLFLSNKFAIDKSDYWLLKNKVNILKEDMSRVIGSCGAIYEFEEMKKYINRKREVI